jgi:hypothetical protein
MLPEANEPQGSKCKGLREARPRKVRLNPAPHPIPMTHGVLVGRAVRWLRGTKGCHAVLREFVSGAGEIPDAIGWRGSRSIVVECKVSLADYYADRSKPSHRAKNLMGWQRYYLTPPGLVDPARHTLPEGFGLLEYDGRVVHVIREAQGRVRDERSEVAMLVSVARRVELRLPTGKSLKQFITEPGGLDEIGEDRQWKA